MFGQLPVWFADVLPVAPVAGCISAGVVEELPVDPVDPVEPVDAALATAAPPPASPPVTASAASAYFILRIVCRLLSRVRWNLPLQ
jgi:hypothetical protein